MFSRAVYAVNWLNIGAIFFLMGPDLGGGVGGLAVITSSFYLGVGLMQVPSGILAARFGPKRVVSAGMLVSSSAAVLTSFGRTVPQVAALRFVVGGGMALVFAPGVVMVAALLGGRRSGLAAGVFNSAYDFGGLFGLFAWVVVAESLGWRPSLVLSGALGIAGGVAVMLLAPQDDKRVDFTVKARTLARILFNRELVLLGLGTLGFAVGNVVVSSLMEFYMERDLGASPALSGLVASAVVAAPIFTAIWAGRRYDASGRPRLVLVASLTTGSAALALAALPSIYTALVCTTVVGVSSGIGYTFAFASARDLNPADGEYDTLAVSWVNGIQLTASFFPPVVFSFLAGVSGYPAAWIGTAALSFVFTVPLLMMREGPRR